MFTQQPADRTAYATQADIEAGNVTGVGLAFSVEENRMVSVYLTDKPRPTPLPVVQQPAAPVQLVPAQRDVVPTRLLAGGASLSMVLGTAGAVAPQLEHVGHAIEMAGFGAGALLAGVALVRSGGAKVIVSLANTVTGSSSSSTSTSSSSSTSRLWGQR